MCLCMRVWVCGCMCMHAWVFVCLGMHVWVHAWVHVCLLHIRRVSSPAVTEEAVCPDGRTVLVVVGEIVPEDTTVVSVGTCANSMK